MKQLIILILLVMTCLMACNNSDSVKKENSRTDTLDQNQLAILATTTKKENISFWVYDYITELPIKNREVSADTLNPKKLIDFINSYKGGDKVHLEFINISHDTIFVKIGESTFLTQQMGTSGADDYMTTTTFTLTELKGIKYVDFDFEEGDHSVPGTYSRQYYLDRNKESKQQSR